MSRLASRPSSRPPCRTARGKLWGRQAHGAAFSEAEGDSVEGSLWAGDIACFCFFLLRLVGSRYELINFEHLPLESNTPLLISQVEDRHEAGKKSIPVWSMVRFLGREGGPSSQIPTKTATTTQCPTPKPTMFGVKCLLTAINKPQAASIPLPPGSGLRVADTILECCNNDGLLLHCCWQVVRFVGSVFE